MIIFFDGGYISLYYLYAMMIIIYPNKQPSIVAFSQTPHGPVSLRGTPMVLTAPQDSFMQSVS